MYSEFISIGLLMLFSAMLPGPDFAMVTKNTLLHSRRAGIFTSLGVGCAILIHISYCALGLAIVISQSILLFNAIKYIGAAYLIYLGITALITKNSKIDKAQSLIVHKTLLSDRKALWQGFLCNLLNPKATLFFLALFTMIIRPDTSVSWQIVYAIEMFCIITAWFISLSVFLSHPRIVSLLHRAEKYIEKTLGVFLVGFGIALAFVKRD